MGVIPNRRECVPPLPAGVSAVPTQFTRAELARRMKRSEDTIDRWVQRGMIPSPYYSPTGYAWWGGVAFGEILAGGPQPEGTYTVAESPRRKLLLAAVEKRKALGFLPADAAAPPAPPQPDPAVGMPPAVTVRPATKPRRLAGKAKKRGRA